VGPEPPPRVPVDPHRVDRLHRLAPVLHVPARVEVRQHRQVHPQPPVLVGVPAHDLPRRPVLEPPVVPPPAQVPQVQRVRRLRPRLRLRERRVPRPPGRVHGLHRPGPLPQGPVEPRRPLHPPHPPPRVPTNGSAARVAASILTRASDRYASEIRGSPTTRSGTPAFVHSA